MYFILKTYSAMTLFFTNLCHNLSAPNIIADISQLGSTSAVKFEIKSDGGDRFWLRLWRGLSESALDGRLSCQACVGAFGINLRWP